MYIHGMVGRNIRRRSAGVTESRNPFRGLAGRFPVTDEATKENDMTTHQYSSEGRSWREMIDNEMTMHKDDWEGYICTLTEEELCVTFDSGFGVLEGEPFTLWTIKRVYFPLVSGGAEWVGSAPRHPCSEGTKHQGGE